MPSKSKTKGSGYEREQAKLLMDTYGGSFVRVPNSGAFIGGSNFHRAQHLSEGQVRGFKGDIIPPDDWKYFNCECKFYGDFTFHQLLSDGHLPILEKWIDQTMEIADDRDINIIFMKFNRKGTYVAFQKKLMTNSDWDVKKYVTYESKNQGEWIFTSSQQFWEFNKTVFERDCINGTDAI